MGTIKIEFNLPEFEKELNVNIVIRKDGEVVHTSVATPSSTPVTTKTGGKKKSGNLMDVDFD